MPKKETKKEIFFVALFVLIFILIFTLATLLFYPKRNPETDTSNISNGIYLEDKNSIDVLLVGSCNMYTSFNPLLFYENTGITSYGRTCPDQTMITSYYYIEETLKRQTPKVIVVDSLFVGAEDTTSRESFNRSAVDFMRPSMSKLRLINALVKTEVPYMQSQNPSSPDKMLTWAGYVFPLLRYHQRAFFTWDDISFFFNYTGYNYHKGSQSHSNYNNMNLKYDYVCNSTEIREDAKEYVPKIIKICKDNNIPLLFVNTPNNYRWDDATVAAAENYVESVGGTFLDLHHEYSDMFDDYNYQCNTGRLNIYGMEIFTERLGSYLVEKYNLKPTKLSKESEARWQNDVKKLYKVMKSDGTDLTDGQFAQICNKNDSILVRWNLFKDCNNYELYKKTGSEKEFISVGRIEGNAYYDKDVKEAEEYSYYIVPCEGAHKGEKSDEGSYVYVEKPKSISAVRNGEKITVTCGTDDDIYDEYVIQKRAYGASKFVDFKTVQADTVQDNEIEKEKDNFYRVMNCVEKNGKKYYSDGTVCRES